MWGWLTCEENIFIITVIYDIYARQGSRNMLRHDTGNVMQACTYVKCKDINLFQRAQKYIHM